MRLTPRSIRRDADGLPAAPTLLHAPDSITRRIGGDVRNALMAGSIFVLQVAHPVVGAGVAEHSKYRTDPWTRLRDIDASERRFVWTDEASARAEGLRLRRIHRDIRGVDANGKAYHSLDPHGYGWVHTVFLDAMIRQQRMYGVPLDGREEERLFVEWYEAALFLGLRDRDLPQSLEEYRAHFDDSLRHVLERTSVVAHLLGDREGPPAPPALSWVPDDAWRAFWRPIGVSSQWLALAGLPEAFRARLAPHHVFTELDEARHARLRAFVRAAVPRLPSTWRLLPHAKRVAA